MSVKLFLPIFFCVCAFWIWHSPDNYKSGYYQDDFRPVAVNQSKQLAVSIDELNAAAVAYQHGSVTLKQLREQLTKTRLVFKNAEALLEYYFPKHVKSYINGPPLYHLDPYPVKEEYVTNNYYGKSPEEYSKTLPIDYLNTDHYRGEQRVVAPVGLQVLDEIIFSDEKADGTDVVKLTDALKQSYPMLLKAIEFRNYYYDHEIMEAARLELVRIFTLGITGFDTPGSLNAMQEAAASLKGMEGLLDPLIDKLDSGQKDELKNLFANAMEFLNKSKDFDSFDRLVFMTDYYNPLFKGLLKMQVALHIKSSEEVSGQPSSWDANADNLFAEDFLNPYYYTLLKRSDDSAELRALGKQLFYDPLLSSNNKMSCASCHRPELAFTDGLPKSLAGVEGKVVLRNSPTLINSVFSDRYFYDLRAVDLEEQGEHVIENHLEFNTSFPEIIKKLNENKQYKVLFGKAFGKGNDANRYRFSAALTSYVASLRSFDSEFDRYARGETKTLSPQVKLGFNLFMGKAACATCHYAPTFSGLVPPLYHENESEVLGMIASPNSMDIDLDFGRIDNGIIEDKEEIYRGSFKTMTVRNVTHTAPYFHNGAYKTLEQVIDFYDKGGAAGVGLSYEVPNQTLPPDHLNLSKKEKVALIDFLKSLTDAKPF